MTTNGRDWDSKTKTDLMIEVWEKLDCESVGREEIEAIETVVRDCFGDGAADPPVVIARLLADEGAVLRHSEVLEMDARRRLNSPYAAMFNNLIRLNSFSEAERSLRDLENLRKKFEAEGDGEGLRKIKGAASQARDETLARAAEEAPGTRQQLYFSEVAEWFSIWLRSPQVFGSWLVARKASRSFAEEFAENGE